jgi:hypothetical protein
MLLQTLLLTNAFALPSEPDAEWSSSSDTEIDEACNGIDYCAQQNYDDEIQCVALYGRLLTDGRDCWGYNFAPGACRTDIATGCTEQYGNSQCNVLCVQYSFEGNTLHDYYLWSQFLIFHKL